MDNHIGNTLLQKLKPGDHIASGRLRDCYEHHGIYIGQDEDGVHKVTHFKGPIKDSLITCSMQPTVQNCSDCDFKPPKDGGRVTTCINCFRRGSSFHIVKYQLPPPGSLLSGHSSDFKKHDYDDDDDDIVVSKYVLHRSPEQVLEAARSNRYIGKYSLMFNNCEDFAVYCMTGKERSAQAENVLHKVPYKVGKVLHLMADGHKLKEKKVEEKVKEKAGKVMMKVIG